MTSKCIVRCCEQLTATFTVPTIEGPIRSVWIERSGNKSTGLKITKNSKICPRHFSPDCFQAFGKRLKKYAVPSLFLPEYIPSGEEADNFCYPIKEPTGESTPTKIKEMLEIPLASASETPEKQVLTPQKTYSRAATKTDPGIMSVVL